MSSTRQ